MLYFCTALPALDPIGQAKMLAKLSRLRFKGESFAVEFNGARELKLSAKKVPSLNFVSANPRARGVCASLIRTALLNPTHFTGPSPHELPGPSSNKSPLRAAQAFIQQLRLNRRVADSRHLCNVVTAQH